MHAWFELGWIKIVQRYQRWVVCTCYCLLLAPSVFKDNWFVTCIRFCIGGDVTCRAQPSRSLFHCWLIQRVFLTGLAQNWGLSHLPKTCFVIIDSGIYEFVFAGLPERHENVGLPIFSQLSAMHGCWPYLGRVETVGIKIKRCTWEKTEVCGDCIFISRIN